MKICPYCSKKIQDKMTICPYCGKSLTSSWRLRIRTDSRYRLGFLSAIVVLIIIIFAGIYSANRFGFFAPRSTCFDQSSDYLNQLTPLYSQWTSTVQTIPELNKDQFERSVILLEGTCQQIIELTPPKCAMEAHKLLSSYMDETLNGYNAFISGEPADIAKSYIDGAVTITLNIALQCSSYIPNYQSLQLHKVDRQEI